MTTYLVAGTALGAAAFCLSYVILAPFYRSEGGWNIVAFMGVVATMTTLALYYRITKSHAPTWLANTMWTFALVCVWWRVTIVLRAQLRRRKTSR